MKVLLTGATGLLGGALLELLTSGGHDVRCLLRENSPNAARLAGSGAAVVPGDASSVEDLRRAVGGAEAVVHVAGIEYAPQVVRAMEQENVGRLVAVSSTSAHSRFEARSGPKLGMEKVVKESNLSWTVVRPAMIFGSERDKNVHRLLRFLETFPFFPMFGSGENLWQPVYYEDCATGVYEALVREAALGKTYDLPGKEPLTYLDLVKTSAAALGRKVRIVHVPLEPARRLLALAEKVGVLLPVGEDQVARLSEDKVYPYEAASSDLDYVPRTFQEGILLEVERLRKVGVLR